LNLKRNLISGEFNKIPRNTDERRRKKELENELEAIDKKLATIKRQLREFDK
jgi:hypothetical protein